MENMAIIVTALWGVMSLAAFVMYASDKGRAKRGAWRIRERTLIFAALFFGAPGAAFAMGIFRHKTRHIKFRILVPVFCVLQGIIVLKVWGII